MNTQTKNNDNERHAFRITGIAGLALSLPLLAYFLELPPVVTLTVYGFLALVMLRVVTEYLGNAERLDQLKQSQSAEALERLSADLVAKTKTIDDAYHERNVLVSLLAHLYPAGNRPTTIEGWDPAWQNCVYIDTPAGQVSYHYHDRESYLFADLPDYTKDWDGHDKDVVHWRLTASSTKQGLIPVPWVRNWSTQRLALAMGCIDLSAEEVGTWILIHDELGKSVNQYILEKLNPDRGFEQDWAALLEENGRAIEHRTRAFAGAGT